MTQAERTCTVKIAFFDMDHTLMDNDCDVSWKQFLIEEGWADPSEKDEAARFYQDYREGQLDIDAFLNFQLRQFKGRTVDEMSWLSQQHCDRKVIPLIYSEARVAVDQFRTAGIPVYLLTATNEAVASPVAKYLGLDGILATLLEEKKGRYTGRIVPPYCYREDKIRYARSLCRKLECDLSDAAYYGDSAADVPMLKTVGDPVMVNASGTLLELATQNGWRIEQWKD